MTPSSFRNVCPALGISVPRRTAARVAACTAAFVVCTTAWSAAGQGQGTGGAGQGGAADTTQNRVQALVGGNIDVGRGAGGDASGGSSSDAGALYGGGLLSASFAKRGRHTTFGVEAGTGLRQTQTATIRLGERASVALERTFGRTRISASQALRRMPYQQILRMTDAVTLASPDLAVVHSSNLGMVTGIGMSRPLGQRTDLEVRYGFDESRTSGQVDRLMHTVGGGIRRRIGRGLDLRFGHTARFVRSAAPSAAPSFVSQDLDLGIDFRRPLSFSRQTTVTFTTGAGAVSSDRGTQYVATGNASLQHALGRTWRATAGYDRRLTVIEGIRQPLLANALDVMMNGSVGPRIGIRLEGAASRGTLGLGGGRDSDTTSGTISTYTASARILVLLFSGWQWYAEQFFYQHELSNPLALGPGVPPRLTRSGARMGLDFGVPLMGRRRSR